MCERTVHSYNSLASRPHAGHTAVWPQTVEICDYPQVLEFKLINCQFVHYITEPSSRKSDAMSYGFMILSSETEIGVLIWNGDSNWQFHENDLMMRESDVSLI